MTVSVGNFDSDGSLTVKSAAGAVFSAGRPAAASGPRIVVVTVSGEVDVRNATDLHAFTARVIEDAPGLVLDLSAVEFLGTTALPMLTKLAQRARCGGLTWSIVVGRAAGAMLRASGNADAFPTQSSRTAAVFTVLEALTTVAKGDGCA